MSLYSILVFLHIAGAAGLFVAIGLEWASVYNLRRITGIHQLREWLKLPMALRFVGGPSALLILATGLYLGFTRWGEQAWIGLGLLGLVVIAALGGGLSARRYRIIAQHLSDHDGPLSERVMHLIRDPVLTLSAWLRTSLALGVVFLMSVKPAPPQALAAIGISLVIGLAASVPTWSNRRQTPSRSPRAPS